MKTQKIPTGYIFTVDGEKGELEGLSIGDYGKSKNIKAAFLGFDREIDGVANGVCLPLSEKWVITVSSQYGCPQKCIFCDVPSVDFMGNASVGDLFAQVWAGRSLFPDITYTDRLNLHFARMGEPTYNGNVLEFCAGIIKHKLHFQDEMGLRCEVIHPVVSTCMPKKNKRLNSFLQEWCRIKNEMYNGQAGLQISLNSTSDSQRETLFAGGSMPLGEIASMVERLPYPVSRKYCLNFAYTQETEIDYVRLVNLFDREKFMVKITPIHNCEACRANNIETLDGYSSYAPYRRIEHDLRSVGFDVLVFIPSLDEESNYVTCGNLVLSQEVVSI